MFKKIFRALSAIVGAAAGYGIYLLVEFMLSVSKILPSDYLSKTQRIGVIVFFALLFAFIFFRLTPQITKQGRKLANNIGEDLKTVSANDILAGVVGLIVGLVIALLITQIYSAISNKYLYSAITLVTYIILGYLGVVVATKKGKEIFTQIFYGIRHDIGQGEHFGGRFAGVAGRRKQFNSIPKILDTSVIIDGRIAEIMKTGFMEGPIVIPEFVLVELRHIADSSDSLKRVRGRRGLDILNKIQSEYGIEIYNTDNEKSLKEIPEVDVKLLKLAQIMNGKVVTNDFNLNKVAAINGVEVLNINELANTIKPVVIPGERMTVTPVKQGKDPNQALAYLDDGTMIVVEDGRKMIGKTTEINVTSVLQTSAGRMIFGRIKLK